MAEVTRGCITAAAALVALAGPARAGEIVPTPEQRAMALRISTVKDGDINVELHFRSVDGHVLFCSVPFGANWDPCTRLEPYVKNADKAVAQFCRQNPNGGPYHALYGDAGAFNYQCRGSRMSRLPISSVLDGEGYQTREWIPLP
jgi:hypothetical protein